MKTIITILALCATACAAGVTSEPPPQEDAGTHCLVPNDITCVVPEPPACDPDAGPEPTCAKGWHCCLVPWASRLTEGCCSTMGRY